MIKPQCPEELSDSIADWMVEHGPDGHCDGHDIIASKAWLWFLENSDLELALRLLSEACCNAQDGIPEGAAELLDRYNLPSY